MGTTEKTEKKPTKRGQTTRPQIKDSADAITWTTKQLADALKITTVRVCQLADEGIFERAAHGKYKVIPSLIRWNAHLRAQPRQQAPDPADLPDDVQDLKTEQAILTNTRRKVEQIKLDLMEGRVIEAETVRNVWTNMIYKCKNRLLSLPAMLPQKLATKSKPEMQMIIDAEIRAALYELAEYDYTDYAESNTLEISDEQALAHMDDKGGTA